MMIRITSPYFVAGIVKGEIVAHNGIAPIIKYMKDWPLVQIQKYCHERGWKVEVLDDQDP